MRIEVNVQTGEVTEHEDAPVETPQEPAAPVEEPPVGEPV